MGRADSEGISRRVLRDPAELRPSPAVERATPARTENRQATVDRRKSFEAAFLGEPVESAELADLLEEFSRLCMAGWTAPEALRQAGHGARPGLRARIEGSALRAADGMSLAEALTFGVADLHPLAAPALRAWERNGQRDADLRMLTREMRRLGEVQQRNTFFQIRSFMEAAAERERRAMREPGTARAEKRINASRGGIARRSRATMRWTDLFVALWRCNVPISEALEAAGDGCGNSYCRHVLHRAAERTREGVPLSTCLAETRLLSAGLIDRLRTGEVSGRLDETLEEFARVMEGDAKELGAQSLFMRTILPVILLFSAGIVFMFGAALGNPVIGLIAALIFLPVAFGFWEFAFRQSIAGDPKVGVGEWERKGSRTSHTSAGKQSLLSPGGRSPGASEEIRGEKPGVKARTSRVQKERQ